MELDKNTLKDMIRSIIREEIGRSACGKSFRQADPSGIISVDSRALTLEDFPFPVDAKGVALKDVFSIEESPRIGAGIMELDHTSLPWTLTYDEIDYVISGTLEIITDGRKITAREGCVLLIPKGSSITFSTPNHTRFLYVVYPANWSETA
ncbi:MAG: cupin domain-containing protein [Synergistaceae bacterium]|jgi:ethanolamine utilization protein EutQ|nr:cupin domain-containing protein [Synergistaceae bacterium]